MKAKNIGPTIEKRLQEIGVCNLADLAEITPKVAYQKICELHANKTIPKCYYLYSLQGALMDLDWRELPVEIKDQLNEIQDMKTRCSIISIMSNGKGNKIKFLPEIEIK